MKFWEWFNNHPVVGLLMFSTLVSGISAAVTAIFGH